MEKQGTELVGRVWVTGDDIDTDQIYHGKYLPLTDPEEMATHAMEFVPGMENFAREVKKGDLVVGGRNFGCGSSREHAVVSLTYSGVACIVAESFSRIFYRNAVNRGLPILECPGISGFVTTGDRISIDLSSGVIRRLSDGKTIQARPLSGLEHEIAGAGGLLHYLKEGRR